MVTAAGQSTNERREAGRIYGGGSGLISLHSPLRAEVALEMMAVRDQDYWEVRVALELDEWEDVRRAMYPVMPSERWVIHLRAGDDASATLAMEVRAATHTEAETVAKQLYLRARKEGGLPERPALMLGVRTPAFGPEPYRRLIEEARRLIETERYELAVIRVQTACELFAELVLEILSRGLRETDENVSTLFPRLSLLDRRARALLQALTGSAIHRQDWWPGYKAHVQRRNGVVHEGLVVSREEAEASREAGKAFMSYLGWLWEGQPSSNDYV